MLYLYYGTIHRKCTFECALNWTYFARKGLGEEIPNLHCHNNDTHSLPVSLCLDKISLLFKRLNSHLSPYIVLNLVTVTRTSNSTLNCNFKGFKYKRYDSKIWVKQQKHEFLKGLSQKQDLKHDNDTSTTGISAAMQS